MRIVATRGLREELRKLVPIALVGIVLGVTSAFIVLKYPVEPLDPPLPLVDLASLRQIADADRATKRKVEESPLPAEIRAVGSAYLAWNAAAASGMSPRDPRREDLVSEIRTTMGLARGRMGDEKALAPVLAELRAYHAQRFLDELARARATKQKSEELDRLGGALLPVLMHNGWIGPSFESDVPEPILRARFKLHWTAVVYGLDDCEHSSPGVCYGLTTLPIEVAELRALLAYLVQHPVVREDDLAQAGSVSHAIDRRRVVYLDRLASLDRFADPGAQSHPFLDDYPFDLGRGVLLYRLGRYDLAAEHFARWASAHPSDTRARNWYLASIKKMRSE